MAAVTVVLAEVPARRVVRSLRNAVGGCLGHLFTFISVAEVWLTGRLLRY